MIVEQKKEQRKEKVVTPDVSEAEVKSPVVAADAAKKTGDAAEPTKSPVPAAAPVSAPAAPTPKSARVAPIKNKSMMTAQITIFTKISAMDIAFSVRNLALMLKTGLPIGDALRVLADQTSNPKLKEIYGKILVEVMSGKTLSSCMESYKKVFSQVIVSIIRVGEQAGTLEKNLLFLADYLKKGYELQRRVKGALIYPFIVFGLTLVEMMGVMFFILPKLDALFSSFENTPTFTVAILNVAYFMRANILFIVVGALVLVVGVSLFLKTKPGKRMSDWFAINFPVIKKLNRFNILANFSRTLSILLGSGIPISSALNITAQSVGNGIYADVLQQVFEYVKGGKTLALSLVLFPKLFPFSYVKIIEAGEKTGTLEENLQYLYESYTSEVEDMSTNLTTLLEPILLVFVGLLIGLLAITIIAPIYQFTSSING